MQRQIIVLALVVSICYCRATPYFVETLVDNPEDFHRNVIIPWENNLGLEMMKELDSYIEENHARFEPKSYMVPMSDGVELYTVVNFPLGWRGKVFPAVLDRTPYGADNEAFLVSALFNLKGYIAITQDMRGRYKSQGVFSFWRDSASDGYDTINWITQQSWSNGDVMAFGISADGIAATTQEGHVPPPPALKAQSLWVATGDVYTSAYYNGAFRESLFAGWLNAIGETWYIPTVIDNEAYSSWWYPIDLSIHWNNTNVPAIHVGGWYDIFSEGTIRSFLGFQYGGGKGAKGNQYLVMNPLGHCSGGQYAFPLSNLVIPYSIGLTYDMFDQAQSGSPYSSTSPSICLYVMGPEPKSMTSSDSGNFWSCINEFPKYSKLVYYFQPNGTLLSTPFSSDTPRNQSIVYDPSNPVPTLGGNNLLLPTCGPYDQTTIELRDDVLTYTSPLLTEMTVLTGNISVVLFVSSSANDTDFMGKLTDVYDGKSYNIIDNAIRMRWRDSDTNVTLMVPHKIYEITIEMGTTSYVFNAGHQIRFDITSSNYPRFSTNLNNGNTLAEGGEPVVATNTVYFGSEYPSRLILPVVPLAALPPV